MKKLLLLIAAVSMSMAVSAQDLFIVNSGSKAGGWFAETTAYHEDLKTLYNRIDYINAGPGCVALNVIQKLDKNIPVLFPWDSTYESSGRKTNTCSVTFEEKELLRTHFDAWYICSFNKEMTAARLVTAGSSLKIGTQNPASMHSNFVNNGLNASFATMHKAVPFPTGSSAIITALSNGEIDYGIIESKAAGNINKSGNGSCMYRLDTTSNNSAIALAAMDPSNKNLKMGYEVVFLLRNATPEQRTRIQTAMKNAHADPTSFIAKLWQVANPKFNWDTKINTYNKIWEDSVKALDQK